MYCWPFGEENLVIIKNNEAISMVPQGNHCGKLISKV